MDKNWYEVWFNSPYYHMLYKHRDDNEAHFFIKNLIGYLALNKDAKILDLACGRGRHAVFLNKLGFDVLGLDLSEENIAFAKQFENERLHFKVHDMRIPYHESEFDVVFNLFTSFGYFDDDQENLEVLKSISLMLKPKGIFVLDYLNSENVHIGHEVQEFVIDGVNFNCSKKRDEKKIIKKIDVIHQHETFSFQEEVRIFTLEQFYRFFQQAGMQINQVFGNYNLNPYQSDKSDRMIIIGSKA